MLKQVSFAIVRLLASLPIVALRVRPDPFKAFMKRTRGRLGPDHTLDY